MKLSLLGAALLLSAGAAFAQSAEPTTDEIEEAYRSKQGEMASVIPGVRWERFRINKVRGWSLKFKRVSQDRAIGVAVLRYNVVAKKGESCAEYRITDRVPLPPPNPQVKVKPGVTVETAGVEACR